MVGLAVLVVLGLSAVTASPVVEPQIIGGENATQGEFPFIVSLQAYGSHFCGGSLISDQWVLTAGHCIMEQYDTQIYYGNARLHDKNAVYPNTVNISKAIRHPHYTNEESWTTMLMRNDVALIKLEHPINFTANVQPIKLPKQNEAVPLNHTATLVGWGYIDDVNPGTVRAPVSLKETDILKKVNLTIFDYPYCDSYNGKLNFSDEQNICAGNDDNTKGQCNGDSGGPLFIDGVQWGIVSWSIKPCISAPGVFTKTSKFIDWINSVIESN